jgi:predicted nucleotidyltransferase
MRLTSKERQIIKETIHNLDSDATIYLFGSRMNDQLLGGDIELLVLSDALDFKDLLKLR